MNDQQTEQPTDMPQDVRTFLESLLLDANISFTDATQKEEMVQELYARLDYFLTSRIIEAIPPEHLDAFTKLTESTTDRVAVETFLQEHIPDIASVMQNAFSEFRALYLGNVETSRDTQQSSDIEDSKE